jgi:hypothetical protein
MGKYTVHGPDVDAIIEPLVKKIVDRAAGELPGVESILLIGGFGRGEGSVRLDGGTVRPIKDFDFDIIFKDTVPEGRVMQLRDVLRRELVQDRETSDPYPYHSFTVDFNATTIARMNLAPDINSYEAKVASHLVYGKDRRAEIKIEKKDVPLRSGARILFQKGISLIGQMSMRHLRNDTVAEGLREMFVYDVAKVYVEIGTALCILGGFYEPSYRQRSELLKLNYASRFPDLSKKLPDLAKKVEYYTKFKLSPDFSIIRDPVSLWFEARDYLLETHRYFAYEYLGVRETDWSLFCRRVRDRLRQEHHMPLIRHNFRERWGINPGKLALVVANGAYQLLDSVIYAKNAASSENYRVVLPDSLFAWFTCPYIDFFCSTLLILHSLHNDGSFSEQELRQARKSLRLRPSREPTAGTDAWEETRLMYFECFRLLPHMF